jgi:hypothetical protein
MDVLWIKKDPMLIIQKTTNFNIFLEPFPNSLPLKDQILFKVKVVATAVKKAGMSAFFGSMLNSNVNP